MASQRALSIIEGREPFVVAELGSCHLGQRDKLFKLSEQAIHAGADGLKVQLFPSTEKYTKANHYLPSKLFVEWVEVFHKRSFLGITVFEQDFPTNEIMSKLAFIKAARSQACEIQTIEQLKFEQTKNPHLITVGSFGYMDCFSKARFAYDVALYCHAINGQTVYPVETILDWENILHNTQIDGLSDHTMSYFWDIDKDFNVKWVEKHVMLDGQPRTSCGDAHFAIPIEDFTNFVRSVKGIK